MRLIATQHNPTYATAGSLLRRYPGELLFIIESGTFGLNLNKMQGASGCTAEDTAAIKIIVLTVSLKVWQAGA
jgi:hypothetical protein